MKQYHATVYNIILYTIYWYNKIDKKRIEHPYLYVYIYITYIYIIYIWLACRIAAMTAKLTTYLQQWAKDVAQRSTTGLATKRRKLHRNNLIQPGVDFRSHQLKRTRAGAVRLSGERCIIPRALGGEEDAQPRTLHERLTASGVLPSGGTCTLLLQA